MDSSTPAAGLAAADATPIALVAMVKANVPNTPLLRVTIFTAVVSCFCFMR